MAFDVGVAAAELADRGTGGESAEGGGADAAIFLAGSNGPRIRCPVDTGGEDCTAGLRSPESAGLLCDAGAAESWLDGERARITAMGVVSASGLTVL